MQVIKPKTLFTDHTTRVCFYMRKAEFALSTYALVASVVWRILKTRVTLGNTSFVFFVTMYLRVSESVVGMLFSLAQFCFHN